MDELKVELKIFFTLTCILLLVAPGVGQDVKGAGIYTYCLWGFAGECHEVRLNLKVDGSFELNRGLGDTGEYGKWEYSKDRVLLVYEGVKDIKNNNEAVTAVYIPESTHGKTQYFKVKSNEYGKVCLYEKKGVGWRLLPRRSKSKQEKFVMKFINK